MLKKSCLHAFHNRKQSKIHRDESRRRTTKARRRRREARRRRQPSGGKRTREAIFAARKWRSGLRSRSGDAAAGAAPPQKSFPSRSPCPTEEMLFPAPPHPPHPPIRAPSSAPFFFFVISISPFSFLPAAIFFSFNDPLHAARPHPHHQPPHVPDTTKSAACGLNGNQTLTHPPHPPLPPPVLPQQTCFQSTTLFNF